MPKISHFLQFESHSSKSFKVRAIWVLRDLYGNKIQGLKSLAFMLYTFFKLKYLVNKSKYNVEIVQKY